MTPCLGLSVINDFSLMSQIVNLSSISLGFICFNKYFDHRYFESEYQVTVSVAYHCCMFIIVYTTRRTVIKLSRTLVYWTAD